MDKEFEGDVRNFSLSKNYILIKIIYYALMEPMAHIR